MNIPKACGPQVLYRCKYCQKCIKGIEAFINHKRENHNDLLELNKNEDLKYEPEEKKHEVVERQSAYRYRPGPKSKKPQLLINSRLEPTASSSKSAPDTILEPDSTTDALIPKTEEDFLSSSSIRNSVERKSTGEESDKDSGNDMSTAETVSCSSGNGSLTDSLIAPVSANIIEGVDDDIMIISGNTQRQHPQNAAISNVSAERTACGEEEDDDIQIIAVLPPAENTSKYAAVPSNTVPLTHTNQISENYQRASVLPTRNRSSGNPIALSHFIRERERSVIQEVIPKGSSTRLVNGLHKLSPQISETGAIAKGWEEKNEEDSDRGAVIRSGSGKAVSLIQSATGENHTSLPSNSIVPKPVNYENANHNNYGVHLNFESDTIDTPDLHNHSLTSTVVVPDIYAAEADSPDESDFIPQIMSVYSEAPPSHSSNTSSNASSPSLPRRINILPVDKARYRFKCWSCDKVFSKKKDRSAHAKVSHGSTVPFKCSICSESFAQERSLMRHKVTHLQYPCPVCDRKCDGKVDFDAHMKSHEKKVRKVIQPQTEAPSETETPDPASEAVQQHTNHERAPVVTIKEACHLIKQAQPREDGRYPCVICSTHLKNKPSLRLHFRIHTGEKPYKCRHCSQTFIQFNHRMRHELKFHSNAQLRPLGTDFSRTVRPTQHVKVSPSPIPKFKTPSVTVIPAAPTSSDDVPPSVKMSLQDALAFLRIARLGPNQRFQCPLCSAQPKSKVTLKLHLRLHTGEKPHKCGVCNLAFRQHSQRKKHEIRIHGGTLTQCNVCPERFRDPMKLKIHQACHRGPKLMRCRFCPELFDGIKSRRDHESQHAQRSKQISDPVHVRQTSTNTIGTPNPSRKFTVVPNGGRRYFCPQCPKVYQYPHQLRAHMGTHGDAWKTFKCSYCPQKFSRSEACSYHENSHTGSRPFKCPNCPKAYPHPMSLIYHKNTAHKGEEFLESKSPEPPGPSLLQLPPATATEKNISPRKSEDHVIEYPCSFCEKTFRNYTHQREHERTHTGEKPYQCQFCDKSFAQSSPWKYHQNTHTGARPFECATCKQTFATPAERTQHERNTHGYVPGSPRTITTTLPAPRSNLAKAFTDIGVANPRINEANLETTQLRNQGNQSVSNFSKRSDTVTKQAKDSYNCRFCRRSFDDATTLRFHEMTHPQSRSVLVSTPSIKSINANVSSNSSTSQVKARQITPPVQFRPLPVSSSTNPAKTNVEGPPFICSTCGKSFHGPKHLEYHENVHTGARPFGCRFCPRAFAHPANLRKHEGVMHGAESEPTAVSPPVFHENREQASPVLLITNTEATGSSLEVETEEAESFNPERPHSCQFCPKAFPSLCTLKYHENTHTGARPYKCGYCPKGFAHPNNRRVHIASMHKNEVEEEQVVGLGQSAHLEEPNHTMSHFLSYDVLELQVIQDEEQDISDQTGKRVLRIQKAGSEVPVGEGPYPCQHCGRRFTQKNSRNYHLNLHTGALPFKCSLCNMAFYHPSMRSKHMVAAHNSESLPTPSPTTSLSESRDLSAATPRISSTRAAHPISSVQNGSRPVASTGAQNFPVTVMPIPIAKVPTVPEIRALKSVKRKRKGKPQHRYIKVKCHLCDKSFRKDYLPIHIRYHTDERIFQCQDCDQSFHHIQALKDHTRRKHSNERPYECEVCGKCFAVPVDLHLHRKTHQQRQRKYGCNTCGKKFLTSADLKGHKLIHARPFPCSHCDKTFELQLHMEDHVRVAHTREQPFQCLRCLQRFSSQITYIKHMDRQACVPKVSSGDQNQGESSGRTQLSDFAGPDESPQFSYNCSLCNCSFSQKELAAAHARWHQEQL